MSEIADFVRARLDDDEQRLHAIDRADGEDRAHPLSVARGLADIATARAIVNRCERIASLDIPQQMIQCHIARVHDAAVTLRLLAAPQSRHPDFRPEWRIEEHDLEAKVLT